MPPLQTAAGFEIAGECRSDVVNCKLEQRGGEAFIAKGEQPLRIRDVFDPSRLFSLPD